MYTSTWGYGSNKVHSACDRDSSIIPLGYVHGTTCTSTNHTNEKNYQVPGSGYGLRCPTLSYAALRCSTLLYVAISCSTLLYAALATRYHINIILHRITLHRTNTTPYHTTKAQQLYIAHLDDGIREANELGVSQEVLQTCKHAHTGGEGREWVPSNAKSENRSAFYWYTNQDCG